jgi:hypothetical protein
MDSGSGSETTAYVLADGRLTLTFCAFEGAPVISGLYRRGKSPVPERRRIARCLGNSVIGLLFETKAMPGAQ